MLYFLPYFELKMIPLWGDYSIESWKIFWILARVAVILILLKEAKRLNLSRKTTWIIFILSVFLVSFFEKILFFFSHKYLHTDGGLYEFTFSSWRAFGRVHFGAIVGIILTVIITTLITKKYKNIYKYLDILLLAHIAGSFIYRIGNLFWHSHIGKITTVPWGFWYNGQVRHEISLYELISLALLFSIAWPVRKRITQPGLLSLIILGWMSLSRFITDFFRSADLPNSNFHLQSGLTLNQVAYGAVFLICIVGLLFITKKRKIVQD